LSCWSFATSKSTARQHQCRVNEHWRAALPLIVRGLDGSTIPKLPRETPLLPVTAG
jgi:hypothetical protein